MAYLWGAMANLRVFSVCLACASILIGLGSGHLCCESPGEG